MSTGFRNLLTFGLMLGVASVLSAQEKAATQPAEKKTTQDQGSAGQDQDNQDAQNQDGARKQRGAKGKRSDLGQAGQRAGRQAHGQNAQLDNFIASCVALENEGEITLSKLAQQRATNPEVKAFAQQMVTEHTAFLEKLRPFDQRQAGAQGKGAKESQGRQGSQQQKGQGAQGSQDAGDAQESQQQSDDAQGSQGSQKSRTAQGNKQDDSDQSSSQDKERVKRGPLAAEGTSGTASAGGHGGIQAQQLIQLKTEIAERCQQSAQRELEEHQGAEFDKAFMAMQVMAHMKMTDELEVAQNHVSGELKQILSEGAETAQKHLRHAKEIKMQLKGSEGDAARTTQKQNQQDQDKK